MAPVMAPLALVRLNAVAAALLKPSMTLPLASLVSCVPASLWMPDWDHCCLLCCDCCDVSRLWARGARQAACIAESASQEHDLIKVGEGESDLGSDSDPTDDGMVAGLLMGVMTAELEISPLLRGVMTLVLAALDSLSACVGGP